ncbi:MAG: hypothetical protein J6R40_01470 [Clostridia bacterium]|nr:hypothetical protein [Clostridia bacterium]
MNFDFSTIGGKINLAMILFFVCTVAFAAWRGTRMRTARSVWRLITVISAAALAFATVSTLLSNVGEVLSQEKLSEIFATADPEIHGWLDDVFALFPSAVALALSLPLSVLAPILFILAFFIYSIPLYIIYLIVAILLFPRQKKSHLPFTRLWGGIAGALKGTVVSLAYIFPLLGLALIVNGAFARFDTSADPDLEKIADTAAEATDAVYNFPGIKPLYELCGDKFFTALTSFSCEIDGVTYECTMSKEMDTFGEIIVDIKPLFDADFENLGEKESDAIKAVAADVNDSVILRVILSEALSSMCQEWSQGNAPLDISKPAVDDPRMQQILDGAIDTFKNTTPDTVGDDLIALANAIDVLISHDVFGSLSDPDSLMDLLSSETFISDLKGAMQESESVKAVVEETVKVGVQSICSTLIEDEQYEAACEEIATEVADALNSLASTGDEAAQAQALASTIHTALEAHISAEDLGVGDAVIDFAAEIIVNEFAQGIADGSVSTQDILGYLGIGAIAQ